MTFIYLRVPESSRDPRPRVMLVDDHGPLREQLREALAEYGVQVIGEADGGALVPVIAPHAGPVVIVMDIRMPDLGGIETLELLRLAGVEAPVIILTGFPDAAIDVAARAAGAVDVLVKGVRVEEIAEAVHEAWARMPMRLWVGGLRG